MKKSSSKWIKKQNESFANFYWQDGYGIFSVNPSEVNVVVKYIDNQEQHHTKLSFKDELVAFLDKYKLDYNEKYLWD